MGEVADAGDGDDRDAAQPGPLEPPPGPVAGRTVCSHDRDGARAPLERSQRPPAGLAETGDVAQLEAVEEERPRDFGESAPAVRARDERRRERALEDGEGTLANGPQLLRDRAVRTAPASRA